MTRRPVGGREGRSLGRMGRRRSIAGPRGRKGAGAGFPCRQALVRCESLCRVKKESAVRLRDGRVEGEGLNPARAWRVAGGRGPRGCGGAPHSVS